MKSSRRQFLQTTTAAGAVAATASILPACCTCSGGRKKHADGKIHVGIIGLGRISNEFEMPNLFKQSDKAIIVAVSDFDKNRLDAGQKRVNDQYKNETCKAYSNYKDLINDPNVDAVMVCTPDHWHALACVETAIAGKDIWVQKPLAQTIAESRLIADLVEKKKLVMQVGAQQRSWWQFRRTCELVRNGRIGKITRVEIGLAKDPSGGSLEKIPVPTGFNYDGWLGPIGVQKDYPYTSDRCHPQGKPGKPSFGRPGWIVIEPFGWGMITNWGAHHLDIAQWGLGMTDAGPIAVEGTCKPLGGPGLWNVHGDYDITYTYPNGTILSLCSDHRNGIKFIGEKGWIFVTRAGGPATKNDPAGAAAKLDPKTLKDPTSPQNGISFGIEVSDPELLNIVYSKEKDDVILKDSPYPDKGECFRHVADWLQCIETREKPIAHAESSHRTNIVCIQGLAAMKLKRPLKWNNQTEMFDDDEANLRFNKLFFEQPGYSITEAIKKAGLTSMLRS